MEIETRSWRIFSLFSLYINLGASSITSFTCDKTFYRSVLLILFFRSFFEYSLRKCLAAEETVVVDPAANAAADADAEGNS